MITIEVRQALVVSRSGLSSKNGKAYAFHEQPAFAHLALVDDVEGHEVLPINLQLKEGDKPYSVGNYRLADSSFYVDRFKNLVLRPVLEPVF